MNKNLKKENNNQINREKASNNHEKFIHGKLQYINFGENDQMEIEGYKPHKLKSRVTLFFYFLTLGLLRLFFHWYPQLKLLSTHKKCSLKDAEKVLITDNYKGKFKSYFVKEIIEISTKNLSKENSKDSNDELLNFFLCDGTERSLSSIRILKCKKLTYIWNDERCKFVKLAGLDKGVSRNDLHKYTGYTTKEQNVKRVIYGYNEIVVPVQSICTLLVLEALTPFYIFQVFSLIVWFCEYYYYYTIAIIIMSVFGISTSIIQTRKNQKNLKGTVHSSDKAVVCRGNGLYQDIPTTYLVPGDVIVIPKNGCEMQCDAILLNGSCVVNESMLTGESVPVTKNSLPKNNTPYNVKEDVNHTLYCGTKVIQTRHYDETQVLAVVIRTAYLTTKGELVRSIMYPPPADFKFDQDSYKFIGILGLIASLGFIYTIVSKSSRNIAAVDILIKALDLVTVAVPPALPAAMTVGKLYALNRLKNHKIFCINSRVINVSGSIDCVCFDKTGTLTEDALDMWGVVPVENNKIKPPIKTFKDIENESSLFRGMASCHSLTLIDETTCGDPLDVKMFESTNWVLEEPSSSKNYIHKIRPSMISKPFASSPNNNSYEIGILKHFQFSSTLQRMSVITKSTDTEHFDIFCKGSPEMIVSLCDNTTVPNDIQTWLQNYTEQGYRVIALATKKLNNLSENELSHLPREDVEINLQFLGLIILENKLKPETHDVIKTLKRAGLKIVMITGDNIQTAIHVGKECGLIDPSKTVIEVLANKPTKYDFASVTYEVLEKSDKKVFNRVENGFHTDFDVEKSQRKDYQFVVTGTSWANLVQYFPDLVSRIVAKGVVFARMSGLQKQQLIEELKNMGYYVSMCGDGANDCGALKAAHVGISLSEAESSVASPFTSKEANISCVTKVIMEGRAALVTSFGVFKMMLCYSLTEFASVIILYTIDTNLTSVQYLFIDIFLILNFSSVFGITRAYKVLDRTPPMTSLLSFIPICSLVSFMTVTVFYQVFAYHFVKSYDWFTPFQFNPNNTTFYECYENYAVYSVSMFQYITMAIVFSKGKPYRLSIITNKLFIISIVIMIAICSYIVIMPANWLKQLFELKIPPIVDSRFHFLVIAFANFATCFIAEDIFIEIILKKFIEPRIQKFKKSQPTHKKLLLELSENDSWPALENNSRNGIVNESYETTENTNC